MVKDLSITIKPEDEKNTSLINHLICQEIKKAGIQFRKQELISVFQKKSIDARHGHIKLHLKYKVYIGEKPQESENSIPEWKAADPNKRVIVVGSGPAGLLAALKLLEDGIKPVVIERGKKTPERRVDIAQISTKGIVNDDSNYCYGEGGAGTFSDGKLYTRSNKRGNIGSILNTFVYFGADKKILTDAHPHIGTDKLPKVINNIRNKIIEKGGEVHFDTRVVDFVIEESRENKDSKIVKGVVTKNIQTGQEETFTGDAVILATGHSSSGIYNLISKISPQSLEAKSFAVGVRVEHPREMIDSIQYHGNTENMPAAEYRVVTQIDGRGVYSFCMCPGGFVVPSASEDDGIVVPAIAVNVPGPQELGIVVPGQENVEVVTEATPVLIAKVDPAPEVSEPEPIVENKPVEETKTVTETNPVVENISVADISSVDESTALAETTTVVAITTPVADSKPTTETKPVIENKPVAELKPVAETEPSTATKPAAQESETKHLPIVPIAATTFTAIAAAGILIAYKKKNEGEKGDK